MRTIIFNKEFTQQPLLHTQTSTSILTNTQPSDGWSLNSNISHNVFRPSATTRDGNTFVTPYTTPPTRSVLSGPMVRTLPGVAKRSCCGGAV